MKGVFSGIFGIGLIGSVPLEVDTSKISKEDLEKITKGGSGGKYATGGIVTKKTKVTIGEDGAEAVIPLENHTWWIDRVSRGLASRLTTISTDLSNMNGGSSSQKVINFTQINNSPEALSRVEIYRQTENILNISRGLV